MNTRIVAAIVLQCCLAYLCSANIATDLRYIHICNRTSPISLRTMNEILINKKLTNSEQSANFKCFLHCLFAKYGWMDDEGGFELHAIRQVLVESSVEMASLEYIMFTCTALKSIDKCERAFQFTECFWQKTSQNEESENKYFYEMEKK